MTNISSLISDFIKKLRTDAELKNSLSWIYDQVPRDAVLPYLFLHLQSSKELHTYDRFLHLTAVTCNVLSNSLSNSIIISEQAKLISRDFFTEKRCVLSDVQYRISHLENQTFQSVINFEVLTSDTS